MASLNNVATQDGYVEAATIVRPLIERVTVQVANAAIYYQLGEGWPGVRWGQEQFSRPIDFSIDRRCSGVRVRSAVTGSPARVTVTTVTRNELPERERA